MAGMVFDEAGMAFNAAGMAFNKMSWPGLARPPTTSHQPHRQIVPVRLLRDDQADLPRPRSPLDVRLPLDGRQHIPMRFRIHKPIPLIARGKRRSSAGLMCSNPSGQSARYASMMRAVRTVAPDVYPTGWHARQDAANRLIEGLRTVLFSGSVGYLAWLVVDGRAKPGHGRFEMACLSGERACTSGAEAPRAVKMIVSGHAAGSFEPRLLNLVHGRHDH